MQPRNQNGKRPLSRRELRTAAYKERAEENETRSKLEPLPHIDQRQSRAPTAQGLTAYDVRADPPVRDDEYIRALVEQALELLEADLRFHFNMEECDF